MRTTRSPALLRPGRGTPFARDRCDHNPIIGKPALFLDRFQESGEQRYSFAISAIRSSWRASFARLGFHEFRRMCARRGGLPPERGEAEGRPGGTESAAAGELASVVGKEEKRRQEKASLAKMRGGLPLFRERISRRNAEENRKEREKSQRKHPPSRIAGEGISRFFPAP